MRVDVIEPLKRLRIAAEPNPYGIAYDLEWVGFTPPYNEEYVREHMGGRVVHERSNYDQTCDVTGWLEFGGQRFEVDAASWTGARDHSWGLGATGGPQSRAAAPPLEISE